MPANDFVKRTLFQNNSPLICYWDRGDFLLDHDVIMPDASTEPLSTGIDCLIMQVTPSFLMILPPDKLSIIDPTGYLNPSYAQSLKEFGAPMELPVSKGWILRRPIPGYSLFDGMGCYPIFACQNWDGLEEDLNSLENDLVSLALVTDPFGQYTYEKLNRLFNAVAKPYKEHYVIDLSKQPSEFVSSHHQRNAQKALKQVEVEICEKPLEYLDEWCLLYDNLIERHKITGITRFSRASFAEQLAVPGMNAFRAVMGGKTMGMVLCANHNNIVYYHLGAYSLEGYERRVSFAIFWMMIEYFRKKGFAWLNLGASAGLQSNNKDGLTRFKQGWATGTRMVFFCGRIINNKEYQKMVISQKNPIQSTYFPIYRAGEFG